MIKTTLLTLLALSAMAAEQPKVTPDQVEQFLPFISISYLDSREKPADPHQPAPKHRYTGWMDYRSMNFYMSDAPFPPMTLDPFRIENIQLNAADVNVINRLHGRKAAK